MESLRLDVGNVKSYEKTTEGFLNLYLTVSKVGDLIYQRRDGSTETEYVSEQELFNENSLKTLTGKPITLGHPQEKLSSTNVKKYMVGSVGHRIITDVPFLNIVAVIHDEQAIRAIEDGTAREVSAGYEAEIIKDSNGKLCQRNRRYNHISLVPTGRAGNQVRAHIDSIVEGTQVPDEESRQQLLMRVRADILKNSEMLVKEARVAYIKRQFSEGGDAEAKKRADSVPAVDEQEARLKYIERLRSGNL